MNWRATRLAIIYLYATGFLLFGFLLIYSAYFGSRPWRFWFYFSAGLPFIAEGVGLFLFLWIVRLSLKLTLAFVVWFFLSGAFKYGFSQAILIYLGFAGSLLFAEIWFRKFDRQIVAARRAARQL